MPSVGPRTQPGIPLNFAHLLSPSPTMNNYSGLPAYATGDGSYQGNGSGDPSSLFRPNPTASQPVNFYITLFNPNILNCTILGPDQEPLMWVVTDPQMPGYTVFRNRSGQKAALIEWQAQPLIEVHGVFSKRRVRDWLKLSPDRSSRVMEVSAMQYSWAPEDQHLNLSLGTVRPKLLARVFRGASCITIEMDSDALQLNILDSALVATVLLQCGRNID